MRVPAVLMIAGWLGGCTNGSSQQPPPPPGSGLGLKDVGTFDFPVFLTSPPGDKSRLFVVEKRGTISIVKQGTVVATPFLDLRARVSTGGEQGLLGLAFHPAYADNGLFVVNYTDQSGDTKVALYRASAANPDRADPASEQNVLTVTQPFANHNGGMVAFGPDGKLYIGTGDGGSGGKAARSPAVMFRLTGGAAADPPEWTALRAGWAGHVLRGRPLMVSCTC